MSKSHWDLLKFNVKVFFNSIDTKIIEIKIPLSDLLLLLSAADESTLHYSQIMQSINSDDTVGKEDEYDDDENNENDEENVIEEMETVYNVSVSNYFSPLLIPLSPDIPVTTY